MTFVNMHFRNHLSNAHILESILKIKKVHFYKWIIDNNSNRKNISIKIYSLLINYKIQLATFLFINSILVKVLLLNRISFQLSFESGGSLKHPTALLMSTTFELSIFMRTFKQLANTFL